MSAKSRLTLYRKRATENRFGYTDWREHRYERHHVVATPTYRHGMMFLTDISIGDDLGPAHNHIQLGHTGWYVDHYCDDTLNGHVVRIRSSRFTMYIPVTVCSGWDGVTYHLDDMVRVERGSVGHEDAINDAARLADRCAEIEAEESREAYLLDEAKQQVEELKIENQALLGKIFDIQAHTTCSAKEHLAELVHRYRQDVASNLRKIRRWLDEPWATTWA